MFCEDIRQEVGGTVSIMGVLPHGISVPELPYEHELGVFIRLQIPVGWNRGGIRSKLILPDGNVKALGWLDSDGIAEASAGMPADRDHVEVSLTTIVKVSLLATGYLQAILEYDDVQLAMAKLAVSID